MTRTTVMLAALAALLLVPGDVRASELRGGRGSMERQHFAALREGVRFARTSSDVRWMVRDEELLELAGNADYELSWGVSHPYARPEVRLFVERLAKQYRAATGEPLVITSLTRPKSQQPRNSHPLSVHPAGLAVDLRVPHTAAARRWLEDTLLSLEADGLIEATRERRPPHYHVAVLPEAYAAHVAALVAAEAAERAALADARAAQKLEELQAASPIPIPELRTAGAPWRAAATSLSGALVLIAGLLVVSIRRRPEEELEADLRRWLEAA